MFGGEGWQVKAPEVTTAAPERLWAWHALYLTLVAFALHYAWESVQCPLFFVHPDSSGMALAMVRAALGDVAMTWVVQAVVAAVSGRWLWLLGRRTGRQWALLLAMGLAMSISFEYFALATGRWSYTPITPLVPGTRISIVPLAQLLVLFPLSFKLTQVLLRHRLAKSQSTLPD